MFTSPPKLLSKSRVTPRVIELQSVRSIDGIARDVAEFLATLPAPRGRLQEVQKNMPTRIAAMQPHCSSVIRSRSTSAAKASVTSG
jgi:hypothetical protein